jgi:hypothetical protein
VKPADHPDFFRLPAPEGRTRESTIRLDGEGRFWHEGRPVEHAGLRAALHAWIGRHPDDGRYILTNGYDWTYFAVDDAPYVVRAVRIEPERIVLLLSDGSEEEWDPAAARVGADGALYAEVKSLARGGPYEAKFTRHAQTSLAPALVDGEPPSSSASSGDPSSGDRERPAVSIGGRVRAIGQRSLGKRSRYS